MAVRGDVIVAMPRSNCSCLSWALEKTVYAGCVLVGTDSSLLMDAVLSSWMEVRAFSHEEIFVSIFSREAKERLTAKTKSCDSSPH